MLIYYMFLFKNNIMSTFFAFNLLHRLDTSSPAFENNLSDGTDVPGIHKYFFASCDSKLNRFSFAFHHASGSSALGNTSSAKYPSASTNALFVTFLVDWESTTFRSNRSHKPGGLLTSDFSSPSSCGVLVFDSSGINALASSIIHCSACQAASRLEKANFFILGSKKMGALYSCKSSLHLGTQHCLE